MTDKSADARQSDEKSADARQSDEKSDEKSDLLIGKESLRPPCKRQRTRSTTNPASSTLQGKDEIVKGEIADDKKPIENGMCEKTEVNRQCSERILRRVCKQAIARSATPSTAPLVKVEALKDQQVDNPPCVESTVQRKNRRQWEQWSDNDVECFFQGLAEHGKDFGSILLFMKKKKRSKHDDDTKTKEQIRCFYHRTWAKLSKSLNLVQETNPKKAYRRELHYMFCLGELRKKGTQGLGQKVLTQLHELATKGSTYVRNKGRNIRVRPPNRYLRKLYRDENSFEDVLLPKFVNIEFLPNSNSSFNYVQMHAFNPRIRFINVNINSKFSEVFDLFDKRFTDLCREGQYLTLHPVISGNVDSVRFAEIISNAEDALENSEKRQESPIILEDSRIISTEKEQLDSSSEDLGDRFPKLFGQRGESPKEAVKPFLGYWTHSTADEIHLRTLFLALGKVLPLKFRYEWKKTEEKPSFATDSLQFLRGYCTNEKTNIKEVADIEDKIRTIISKKKELKNPVIPVVNCNPLSALSSFSSHGICLTGNKQFGLPLRPRPGRQRGKRNILNSQMCVPQNRVLNVNLCSQQLNNAVAVNLIAQPPGLTQFSTQSHEPSGQFTTQLPESSTLLNNNAKTPLNLYTQPVNGMISVEDPALVVREEVIEEGFSQHFKSLASILASSSLINENMTTKDIKEILMKTPTKKNTTNSNTEPPSPNLDWLNGESLDITLSSFLNVSEMQLLQEKMKGPNNFQLPLSDVAFKEIQDTSIAGLKSNCENGKNDPKLPVFHSGDTSQEPFASFLA